MKNRLQIIGFIMASVGMIWHFGSGVCSAGEMEVKEETLPAYYDCRSRGQIPLVRSQGKYGTCWAISAASALEGTLMPEEHLVFSPDHIARNNGFAITLEAGGDTRMIMAYLAGWRGPVLEEEDPYGDGMTEDGLESAVHVQEIRLLEGAAPEEIKRLIMENGPVQTSLCMDRKMTRKSEAYYNADTYAFYDPVEEKVTHDIVILGWDDSFSAGNFAQLVPSDGAWICQNTWGTSFGDNGIFYVSYADANILKTGLAYTAIDTEKEYDTVYQTDPCGWQARIGYDDASAYFANVYTAGRREILKAAGFYSVGEHTSFEIWLCHDVKDTGSFSKKVKLSEGEISGKGFFTVPFDADEEILQLAKGERFALIVRIVTEGTGKPVAVEMKKDQYTETVTLEGKEGYISQDGVLWDSSEKVYATNICLKAYTFAE